LTDSLHETHVTSPAETPPQRYNSRNLSYATTFGNPIQHAIIRAMEWVLAKPKLLQLVRQYEAEGVRHGQAFWTDCLRIMGIELRVRDEDIANIPKEGPLVVVANHPHGFVDGMILAELVGRVRQDYKVLTRTFLAEIPQVEHFLIPVAFQHHADAHRDNLMMRKKCMEHLQDGGTIILFPAGVVAHSESFFGPAIEQEWNPFTAKLIRRSGASVIPVGFPGRNSRGYQIANKISATVRQGMLLHEVRFALNKPQYPVVGKAILPEDMAEYAANASGLMSFLRARALELREEGLARIKAGHA